MASRRSERIRQNTNIPIVQKTVVQKTTRKKQKMNPEQTKLIEMANVEKKDENQFRKELQSKSYNLRKKTQPVTVSKADNRDAMNVLHTEIRETSLQQKSKEMKKATQNRVTIEKVPNSFQATKKVGSNLVKQIRFERNDLCFAKMTGHAPWPAQILEISDNSPIVRVYFFGECSVGQVYKSRLFDFESYYKNDYSYNESTNKSKKAALLNRAVSEVLILLGLK